MALQLSDLSNDILLDIFSFLSRKSLYNVSLVSSQLAGLAQRFLYRSISLKIQVPSEPGQVVKVARLVQTLIENPHLQPYVFKLAIELWLRSGYSFGDHSDLLRRLPRLQSLSLEPPPYDLQTSMISSSVLETLHLSFSRGRDTTGTGNLDDPLEIIGRMFWAPHLRRVLIDAISFNPELGVFFPPHLSRSSFITDLEFRSCDQQKIAPLPEMLSCIKALERFALEIHTPWEASHIFTKGMDPAILSRAVGIHAETLVCLEIAGSDAAEFVDASLFGSLARYPKLKKVAIPDELLLVVSDGLARLVDVLPPSLEELQLQFRMNRMQGQDPDRPLRIDRLRELAAVKKDRFPTLKRVILWCQPCECWSNDGSLYGPLPDMEDLKATFQEVGVGFEFLSEPYYNDTPFGGNESDRPTQWFGLEDEE